VDYIHIDDGVPTNGSGIEFQSKTPRFMGKLELTGTCSIGCRNSSGSGGSDGGMRFVSECRLKGTGRWRCRLEGAGETHCESLRLRIPCTETSVWIEPAASSSVSSIYPLF
jgi:hypothetical protein